MDANCQGQLNLSEVARQYAVQESSPTPEQLKPNGVPTSFNTCSRLTYSRFKPGPPVLLPVTFLNKGWDSNQFWVVVDGTFLPGMDQGLKFRCHIQ
ncbi:hypothetical protein ABBQ32_003206 [Trebouxia sp. C0010 RCD-2024]